MGGGGNMGVSVVTNAVVQTCLPHLVVLRGALCSNVRLYSNNEHTLSWQLFQRVRTALKKPVR